MRFTIADHYFGFAPMDGHQKTCSRYGTALWEVARLSRPRTRSQERGGDVTEITTRTMCTECGVVRMDTGEGETHEHATVDQIGFGSKPVRCAGLWLHAGPQWGDGTYDQHGPERFYVTGSPARPGRREDVIGSIGWYITPRGAVRWSAGYGLTEYGGPAQVPEPNEFKSRTAAAKWVAEQHAAQLAVTPSGR